MKDSIVLTPAERNALFAYLRRAADPQLRLRAHIILLLAEGYTWALVGAVLFCSSRTIARWQARFQQGRVPALLGQPRGAPVRLGERWRDLVVAWVLRQTPRAFGFLRSRWCCALVALLLERDYGLDVGRETVRRWLHKEEVVWRRPRPVLKRQDPAKESIWQELRTLLRDLPADETAVFLDEVDVSLNPKLGCMWMLKGQQAAVVTPGDNEKRYLAGSLHWRTGLLLTTAGPKRDSGLFLRHLDDLRGHLRRYKKIHIILDNAKFHSSWAVCEYYWRWGDRIQFHFLPKYAPDLNPIERIWWHLHEEITRNHTCKDMAELIELVLQWLGSRKHFQIEGSAYANLHQG